MKLSSALFALFTLLISAFSISAADPVPPQIQNVVAVQRPGTYFVDITYDLVDLASTGIYITAEASVNSGALYNIPIWGSHGDVGVVAPGQSRKLVWNAWRSWAGNFTDAA